MEGDARRPRAYAYFDVQNLFGSLREAWGVSFNEYDPVKLAEAVGDRVGFAVDEVYFYSGRPTGGRRCNLERFWGNKLPALEAAGVHVFSPRTKYDTRPAECPKCHGADVSCARCGLLSQIEVPREKRVDVRIALDLVLHAQQELYEAAIIFSQDGDLEEAVAEAKAVIAAQGREVPFVSAFPFGTRYTRGITRCKPYIFMRDVYDGCIDPNSYGWPAR